MLDTHCNKNIFQLWEENDRRVPFVVRRWNWKEAFAAVVERVECEEMPYGKAYGYALTNGAPSDYFKIYPKWKYERELPNAGSYQWKKVDIPVPTDPTITPSTLPQAGSVFGLHEVFTFGKYKGKAISEVIEINPRYVKWAIENVEKFTVDYSVEALLSEKVS